MVEHFFATTNHHWMLFFTTAGPGLPDQGLPACRRRPATPRAATWPVCCRFQPDEQIAQVLAIRDYEQSPYLVLATRNGLVKKTRLADYNSPRQAGVIAINFRDDDDELIGAELCGPDDDVLLISRKGQAIRFRADDAQLRPMGRATSGVTGMKFRGDDAAAVACRSSAPTSPEDAPRQYVFTVTDGGFAKRTAVEEYRAQGRGGLGHQGDEAGRRPRQPGGWLIVVDERRGHGHQGSPVR